MLTYSFLEIGSDSLYEHLYKCIRKDVMNGTLAPGTRLPSKRSFAKHLGISVITVENAYEQLMAEGYIYSIPKKGYYVENPPESGWWEYSPAINQQEDKPDGMSQHFVDLHHSSHIQDRQALHYSVTPVKTPYLADFLSNHTHPENFPFSIWAKLMREVLTEETDALLTPPPSGGILPLRNAIAKHLLEFRGMHVVPEQIIIGAGTEYLYELLIQLLGRDQIVGLENPGYKKIGQIYQSNEVTCRYIAVDNHGPDMRQLSESDVNIMHLSPSHHYPTGIVTPISRRYELLAWASSQHSRYIIEDDYDCEFRLLGRPIPALQSIDVMEKVIYMNTFTKSLASTIRISYMVLPKHLLQRFYERLGFYACTVSNFEQYTLARFISEGYFEKHINRMRSYYRQQRDRLIDAIENSSLSQGVICEEDAGLHFLLRIKTRYTDLELVQRAQTAGIRITCLSQYYHAATDTAFSNTDTITSDTVGQPDPTINKHNISGSVSYENTLVINYSGMNPEHITEAITKLAEILY